MVSNKRQGAEETENPDQGCSEKSFFVCGEQCLKSCLCKRMQKAGYLLPGGF